MTSKKYIELKNFFIFNSEYGSKEGEELKKVLYYYPPSDGTEIQIKNIGLVEGIVQFTDTFKPSKQVSSLHTNKLRQLYFQPETNFWIVMTLYVPLITRIKDNVSSNEYLEDDLQDNVYEAVLSQAYHMYRLFWGTFCHTLNMYEIDVLKSRLDIFFNAYLKTLKLENADILNVFAGVQYLPLNRQTFLKVQSFVNLLESTWECIEQVIFLYNEHVIWNGIEPNDMQIIYQYLIGTLLPANMETELQGGSMPRNSPFAALKHGRFITGPSDLKQAKSVGTVPKIYLTKNDKLTNEYHLIVYRSLSATMCLFVKGDVELSVDLFKKFDEFISPKLTPVITEIAEYCTKQIPSPTITETIPKYIYFNKMNLAYKSTVHLDNKQTGHITCSKDCLKIMADLKYYNSELGERIVKTRNDFWVVSKNSNLREFFIVLLQKNANLIEISDEVKKICENELKGIFFHQFC